MPVGISTYLHHTLEHPALYHTKAHAVFFSCHGLRGYHAGLYGHIVLFFGAIAAGCRRFGAGSIILVRRGGMFIVSRCIRRETDR